MQGSIPDVKELADQRKEIAIIDAQHSALEKQLTELKKLEEKVIEALKEANSSLELVNHQTINNELKLEQKSLIEKGEKKQSSRKWITEKRASMSREIDLAEVNELITDIDKVVTGINNQIDELEKKIKAQNKQAAEMEALLVQKEEEKKQLDKKIHDVQKERELLALILKEAREIFEGKLITLVRPHKLNTPIPELYNTTVSTNLNNVLSRVHLVM